ncbi:DUF4232 domain-containing protein [Yinghuangia sp. ASG 101]|uniref:DUF4232 domain-containing protein n=1 Tax=Yinghuangia sp. ASG 101 TaxID=2896848 RepID=UPI001E57D927|nr:DUF4232 domain-containing protein [Yinghuangia sp. ASG 101]UGQ12853.1 DUF4232 domain-containing protein [Yinghuangia sp. ASG 101]
MRKHSALALLPLLALAAVPAAHAAPGGHPAGPAAAVVPPPCAESDLTVEAAQVPPIAAAVVLVHVTSTAAGVCVVDRFPTVTFADLDGSARPEPPASSAPYAIAPGGEVFAAVRTEDGSGNARYVPSLTVAPDPSHTGTTFTAGEIGAPVPGIPVYDPVTTWWHATPDDALAALPS